MATKYGNIQPTPQDLERFMAKVDKNLRDDHWYVPQTVVGIRNRSFLARTAAYILMVGPLTTTERVVVTCDFRLCCNPDHLAKKKVRVSSMGKKLHRKYRDVYR